MSEHLVRVPGTAWAFWRCAALRAAGFPANGVLQLAAPDAAQAATDFIKAEDEARQARDEALEVVNRALDFLRLNREWDDDARRDPLIAARRSLKQGRTPDALGKDFNEQSAVAMVRETGARLSRTRRAFDAAFEISSARTSLAIRKLASEDKFREAITWQNRRSLSGSIGALLRMAPGDSSRAAERRKREELVASYLQRYSVKNDTIGFFGPVAWAEFSPEIQSIQVRVGPQVLAARQCYFEGWPIDALAATLSKNKALRPWIAPRRIPFIRIEGTKLHTPFEGPLDLSDRELAVVEACDGQRTAAEIATVLRQSSALFASPDEVYACLEDFNTRGLIVWALETPLELYPERTLRRQLMRIEDLNLRSEALEPLNQMEAARDRVATAAGDPEKLDRAMECLETTFTELTGMRPTRSAGRVYAARTLVYEDCRSSVEVKLGKDLIDAIGPPLGLLLTSARWLTYQAALVFRTLFERIYDDILKTTGSQYADGVTFWLGLQRELFDQNRHPVDSVVQRFQERWAALLLGAAEKRAMNFSTEQLRDRVAEAFDAPGPGWKSALYHSPDLLISAPTARAIEEGDYELVMGELHVASNTLRGLCFVGQHPEPDSIYRAFESDLPEVRLVPVTPKRLAGATTRTAPTLALPKDYRLEVSSDACGIDPARLLPLASLVIERVSGGLVLRTRDGRLQFDVIEAFSDVLSSLIVSDFKLLPRRRHSPRVTIDRLIACRETWAFSPEEIRFAYEKTAADRFLSAGRWASRHGIPRFCFARLPVEAKPLYVDFTSPIYVDILAKNVRLSKADGFGPLSIAVAEMVPGPGQTWLPIADGNHHTCEFRIVAVDPKAQKSD